MYMHMHMHAQAELVEDELDGLRVKHSQLVEQLKEREDILRRLENETSSLKDQLTSSQSEVQTFISVPSEHFRVRE